MSKPQIIPVYSSTHEHNNHSWLVDRIKSKPVHSRLRRLLSRPFQLSHTNSSTPAHVVPSFKIRTRRSVINELGPYGNPNSPSSATIFEAIPYRACLIKRETIAADCALICPIPSGDQVDKLRRCRQVVPVPTVGPFALLAICA